MSALPTKLFSKMRAIVTLHYSFWLEYRAELVFWSISSVLPLIMMALWVQAAQSGRFALGPEQFAHYFLAVFFVRQLSSMWVIWEFEEDMVTGQLSPYLLQPIDPVWRYLGQQIGERLARMPLLVLMLGLMFVAYPFAFWMPQWNYLLAGLAATLGAFMLRFFMQYTSAMLCFWSERAVQVEQLWMLFYLTFSGTLAPLDVYPPALRAVILYLPFPYLIDFPARLVTGMPTDMVRGFVMLGAWTVIFFVLTRVLWRKGLKQYSGMGA